MENEIVDKLKSTCLPLGIKEPFDGRNKLARNIKGRKWKSRNVKKLKGMVWHQELAWGSIESVARYHTGKHSHLVKGGVESIAYTFAIRRNGQIVLCNNLNKATWSQGFKGRKGDENAEFLSVMFEGMFHGVEITDTSAGEPNYQQMMSALILWHLCKDMWEWQEDDLYGHYLFGKQACPGDTLQTIIGAVRVNCKQKKLPYDFRSTKGRQKALKKLNYYKGKIDGIWGPGSKRALLSFQDDMSIAVDGIWGPRTQREIIRELG